MKTKYVIGDHSIRINQFPYSNVPGVHIWQRLTPGCIGNAVAFIYNVDGEIDNKHTRLFTAAPSLLKACKKALLCLKMDSDMEEDFAPEIKLLEKVISEAEGR
jgi:hypothetical protein